MATMHEFEFNNKVYLIEEDDDGDFFIVGDDSRCFSSLESAQYRIELTESEKPLFQKCLDLGVKFFRHWYNDVQTIDSLVEEGRFYFRFAYIPSFDAGKAVHEFLENETELYYNSDMENALELLTPFVRDVRWDSGKFPCAISDTKTEDYNFTLITSDDFYHIKQIFWDKLFN